MAFRFQRRIRLAPGIRLNVSKRGVGFSVGPRGASISVGPSGTYRHVGIPGTGLSSRQRIGGGAAGVRSAMPQSSTAVHISVKPDGTVEFAYEDGAPVPASVVRDLRTKNTEAIQNLIGEAVRLFNRDLDKCLAIHLATPSPNFRPLTNDRQPPSRPSAPVMQEVGFWDRLLGRRKAIEARNAEAKEAHADAIREWEIALVALADEKSALADLNDGLLAGNLDAQDSGLKIRLSEIDWIRDTEIAFDFGNDTTSVAIDVNLPTIDELPNREAVPPSRGLTIRWKARTDTQRRRDYSYIAHASIFRVAGEAFATLPKVDQLIVAGYTQIIDPATGHERDSFLISVKIDRAQWAKIDFGNLAAIAVEQALDRFDVIRKQSRTGEFSEITPHQSIGVGSS